MIALLVLWLLFVLVYSYAVLVRLYQGWKSKLT